MSQVTENPTNFLTRQWKPYTSYKRSGVEWLGKVPEHWNVRRLKFVTGINPEVLPESTDPDYEIQYVDIGNVSSQGETEFQSLVFSDAPSRARRRVIAGDVIISTESNTIVSTGFAVLRPFPEVDSRFLYYTISSKVFISRVMANSIGVSYPAINPTSLADLYTWVPPIAEQKSIARFLDRETTRIDTLITKKRQLIDLLQKKRDAIIYRSVTQGLDENVDIASSGIDWLENIPSHWKSTRLKFITSEITVGIVVTPAKYYVDSGIPCLRSLNVKPGKLVDNDLVFISPESNELHRKSKIYKNDLVVVRSGQTGTSAVVDQRFDCANCIDLIIVRQSQFFDSSYLVYLANSDFAKIQFSLGSDGAIQQHFLDLMEQFNNILMLGLLQISIFCYLL
jgi:type I restriction enzyme, S subunit